jgi:hypothetical protein
MTASVNGHLVEDSTSQQTGFGLRRLSRLRKTQEQCAYLRLWVLRTDSQHNSPRIVHHEKIKNSLDEFLILLE